MKGISARMRICGNKSVSNISQISPQYGINRLYQNKAKEKADMRRAYDSDITREQFVPILQDLENVKKNTRPRKVDLYDIFRAILYLLKNACTWRNMPHDFPNWRIARYY
jgi:hypothetical protein